MKIRLKQNIVPDKQDKPARKNISLPSCDNDDYHRLLLYK